MAVFAIAVFLAACRSAVSAPEGSSPAAVLGPPAPPLPPPSNITAEQSRRALEEGLDAYEADDFTAAMRAFRRAARGPKGVPRGRARYMLGLSRLALEQYAPARDILLQAAREYPVLGDHALYYAGKAALDAGDDTDGVRILSQLRLNYLNSVWRGEAARLVGLAFLKMGNPPEARKALARALGEGVDELLLPETRLAFGEAQEKSGSMVQAVRVYRDLWSRYPETNAADEAGARFTSILKREGQSPPYTTYQARAERASLLFSRYSYEKALAAYRDLAREARDNAERYRLAERTANCLFRLKRYPEATRAFAALRTDYRSRGAEEEAMYWEARSVTREGRFDEALEMHRRIISRYGRSEWARESRYRLALLLEDRGRLDEAVGAYQQVLGRGTAEQVQEARWRLGWIAWKQGRASDALENFRRLAAGETGK
ncbi:MAG: tetratricopeptide repeat protein, partial [Deltaproteobacteria bacterium]|nr:tetratricopeptide repeat protein [Deltaproteobacteria bacterium]